MNHFTDEEIKAAKATRDEVISNNIALLKSIYMAGEICMWNELRTQPPADQDGLWEEVIKIIDIGIDNSEHGNPLAELKSKFTILPKGSSNNDGWFDVSQGEYKADTPYSVIGENWPHQETCSYWILPGDEGWHDSDGNLCYGVTHFRHLPKPPDTLTSKK